MHLRDDVENVSVGSIDGFTDWTPALKGVDAIIHLAARVHVMRDTALDPLTEFLKANLHGTINLAIQAANAGIKRFVYVSSIKVNGEQTSEVRGFTEADPVDPQDPYAISKWQAEIALREIAAERGLEVVIVRTPLVYGPGVKGNFIRLLKAADKGIPLPLANAHNLRSLLYVGNMVDALLLCATQPAAAGQTYLLGDDEDVSTSALLRSLGEAMGRPARLFRFHPVLLKLAGRMAGKAGQVERLLGSLRVDSGKIRRELNWKPPYTLQQGLQATAAWYRNARL
jgi:nucleoside-diphosphate-sugar epimerase